MLPYVFVWNWKKKKYSVILTDSMAASQDISNYKPTGYYVQTSEIYKMIETLLKTKKYV